MNPTCDKLGCSISVLGSSICAPALS